MNTEYVIPFIVTCVVWLAAISLLSRQKHRREKKNKSLLTVIILLNIAWALSNIFIFLKPVFPMPDDPLHIYWFKFIIESTQFLLSFGFLFSFLSLLYNSFGSSFGGKTESAAIKVASFLILFWLFGRVEIPLLGSRHITMAITFFTYTLIALTIITAALFALKKSRAKVNGYNHNSVIILCVMTLFFMFTGFALFTAADKLLDINIIPLQLLRNIYIALFTISYTIWECKYLSSSN